MSEGVSGSCNRVQHKKRGFFRGKLRGFSGENTLGLLMV